ncbi:MAG: hypothetical protein COV31_01445 [Candidatus Yanofskybacteria bacterium CG10_big_fil_rev_8_21_14_0_10_46_23]|uniref:Uncharacterized protein n=1 Tax=Candidatus Yanofskybacteria bacterium CG10_big_fil_rev_8_21_14_0_10_46_23 TaxID=1975098 RepID=A0A2H0R4R4_9BACT|nr:MAG: hypothetical protein COV31_01445 [Candidatus Yanofskybacteria bacterium CG10_big_fil_rev_8_21_14_0_10_46_23]
MDVQKNDGYLTDEIDFERTDGLFVPLAIAQKSPRKNIKKMIMDNIEIVVEELLEDIGTDNL